MQEYSARYVQMYDIQVDVKWFCMILVWIRYSLGKYALGYTYKGTCGFLWALWNEDVSMLVCACAARVKVSINNQLTNMFEVLKCIKGGERATESGTLSWVKTTLLLKQIEDEWNCERSFLFWNHLLKSLCVLCQAVSIQPRVCNFYSLTQRLVLLSDLRHRYSLFGPHSCSLTLKRHCGHCGCSRVL